MRRGFREQHLHSKMENGFFNSMVWVLAQLSFVTVVVVLMGVRYISDPIAFLLYIVVCYVPLITALTFWLRRDSPIEIHES
jgi:hypothetical protein